MSLLGKLLSPIKKLALGDTLIPQEFTIGLVEPQSEVSVWLHGVGAPRDVTANQSTACTSPLTVCIAFEEGSGLTEKDFRSAFLKFCERGGQKRVLGKLRLLFQETISCGGSEYFLFRVKGSTNYCLPRTRLWAHYALHAYSQWRRTDPPDMKMTLLEQHAACVTFIRPHPLCLVSVGDKSNGNIFPMNLMGNLGNGYFGFALREKRRAAHIVERAGCIAMSGVPLPQCSVAFKLARNHRQESIDWGQLGFETRPSATFGIPVPVFATRVREMRVQKVHPIGGHRFFIARTVSDETLAGEPETNVVHGFYQYWRMKGDRAMLKASVAEDYRNKRGLPAPE